MTTAITHDFDEPSKPTIKELTAENVADIVRAYKSYGQVPQRYLPAMIEVVKKSITTPQPEKPY